MFLWEIRKVSVIRSRIRHYKDFPESERKPLFEELSGNKTNDELAKNTRIKVPCTNIKVTGCLSVTDQSQ